MKRLLILTASLGAAAALLWSCSAGTQTVTICKKTNPAGGTGFPIKWASGSAGVSNLWATLNDGQCATLPLASGQDHYNRFSESVPAGWTLTNISCAYTTSAVKIVGANPNPAFQPGDDTVTVNLNEPNVICTFTNELPACCGYTLDLSTGQGGSPTDPLWGVNNGTAFVTPPAPGWMGLAPARWIQPVGAPLPSPGVPAGAYQYLATFTVPDCPSGHVELTGSYAADNGATALLDGNPIPGAACSGWSCFNTPQAPVPLNLSPVPPGAHTLQITVSNQGSYSGLIVNARLRRVCP